MQNKTFSWVKVVFVGTTLTAVSTGCGTSEASLENVTGKDRVKAIENSIKGQMKDIYDSAERGLDPVTRVAACCGSLS